MESEQIIQQLTDKVEKSGNVKALFGDPIREGGITLIPVANIKIRGGGGGGKGEIEGKENGKGFGMGMITVANPLGFIEIKDGEAKFNQIIDMTKVAIAIIFAGFFAVILMMKKMHHMNHKM